MPDIRPIPDLSEYRSLSLARGVQVVHYGLLALVEMRATQLDLAPMSEALTHGVRVEVLARHSPENSQPLNGEWVFEYTVRITNQGSDTVQLLSRHWIITDASGETREVKGSGVVGEHPVLGPGQSFKYSSWCPWPTPTGMLRATFLMTRAGGNHFEIEIAPFGLKARYSVN